MRRTGSPVSRSRCVAEITLTSTRLVRVEPKGPDLSAVQESEEHGLASGWTSPTSSRNTVPPSATLLDRYGAAGGRADNLVEEHDPTICNREQPDLAPHGAGEGPRSRPNSSLSNSSRVRAPQHLLTLNTPARFGVGINTRLD